MSTTRVNVLRARLVMNHSLSNVARREDKVENNNKRGETILRADLLGTILEEKQLIRLRKFRVRFLLFLRPEHKRFRLLSRLVQAFIRTWLRVDLRDLQLLVQDFRSFA